MKSNCAAETENNQRYLMRGRFQVTWDLWKSNVLEMIELDAILIKDFI
jgi:hypothetical protein